MYIGEKVGMREIAHELKINIKSVIKILKLNKVEIRKGKKNRIGNRYDRLKVVRYTRLDNSDKPMWECWCECGNKVEARGSDLETGKIKSCGCLRIEKSKENIKISHKMYPRSYGFCGIEDIRGAYLSGIKHRSMKKGREYSVSNQYLWDLYLKQNRKCAMTGMEIKFNTGKQTASLDRIDSKKGYVEGNVQWVHKDINSVKHDYTVDQFRNYCKLVANYKN